MGSRSLVGKRVLVVGASAGIGRAFAVRAVKEGARVVMAARRADRLDETAVMAGGGDPIAVDVRRVDDCARLADHAREKLGEIDILMSSVGYAPLRMIADTTADDWRNVLETNVVGLHQVIGACLPIFSPAAIVTGLSSEGVGQARTALGAYATSKAALERLLFAWRAEHPEIRFCCVVVGSTFPTDFGNGFEPELLTWALDDWAARGLAQQKFMTPDDVADVLAGVLASVGEYPDVCLEDLTVRPPSPVSRSFEVAVDDASTAG